MGLASSIGGWIVVKDSSEHLHNFPWLGWIAVGAGIVSIWLASRVHVKDVRTPSGVLSTKEAVEVAAAAEF
jgi:hypothetical protein